MQLILDIPQQLQDAVQCSEAEFARQAKMAMASKLYEMGKPPSGMAVQMASIRRADFLLQLGQYGVAMIDLDRDEILSDIEHA